MLIDYGRASSFTTNDGVWSTVEADDIKTLEFALIMACREEVTLEVTVNLNPGHGDVGRRHVVEQLIFPNAFDEFFKISTNASAVGVRYTTKNVCAMFTHPSSFRDRTFSRHPFQVTLSAISHMKSMFKMGLLNKQWCHFSFQIPGSKTEDSSDKKGCKRSLLLVSEYESTKSMQLARKMASLEFPEDECADFSELNFER